MSEVNVIQRRELDPLRLKANALAQNYEKAVGCITAVMGPDYKAVELSKHPKAMLFCSLCKRYSTNFKGESEEDTPCSEMHRDAVKEARKQGGSHIYTCPIGFFHWASPFFSVERFAGAFISGGILAVDKSKAIENISELCGGEIPPQEIEAHLSGIPQKSIDEVKPLAVMMQMCAEKLSSSKPEASDLHGARDIREGAVPAMRERERLLLASLRRGDNSEAKTIVRKIIFTFKKEGVKSDADTPDLDTLSANQLERAKFRAVEIIVLLSRVGPRPDENSDILEMLALYINRLENSETGSELYDNLCLIIERMSGKIFRFQGLKHASALRKAERFIWENYTKKLSLKEIADVSGLSAPYFSTVFKEEMGENLSNYLNRLRIGKAAAMLLETDLNINSISEACGFEDQSWFSKVFKSYAGSSPYTYRKNGSSALLDD